MSVANPQAEVIALDLAGASLRRARLHCLLNGRRNVLFLQGNLLDPTAAPGPFHFIDSFGVLHHLDVPVSGLRALERRLIPGGILRVMVYGRYARQEAESIRRAVKLLGVSNVADLKRLLARPNRIAVSATILIPHGRPAPTPVLPTSSSIPAFIPIESTSFLPW